MSDMTGDRHPPAFPVVGGDRPHDSETSLFDTSEPIPPQPAVSEPVPTSPTGGRLRWVIAAVATIAVLAVVGSLVFFGGSRAGAPSAVAHLAPADVDTYVELRLDMPGDQRDRLAQFMSTFPGFADQASFERKIDETLTSLLRSADGSLDWTRDVEPWFGGQVAIFGSGESLAVALTVTDRAALDALLNQKLAGVTITDEDYNGVTLRTLGDEEIPGSGSFAVTDDALVAGSDPQQVRAALDAHAGRAPGLAEDEFFLRQLGSLHADRLATIYFAQLPGQGGPALPGAPELPTGPLGPGGLPMNLPTECLAQLGSPGAVRAVAELRAEGDHLLFTARAQPTVGDGPPLPDNKASVLSASMPADSVAYFELRQVGATISYHLGRLMDCVGEIEGAPDLGQLESFLGTAPENYFDFVDDAAVAVTLSGDQPSAGLMATVDDEAVARTRVERLLTTVRALAGLGDGLQVADETHGNATLTVFTMQDGLSPESEPISFAVTVANGRLYIGMRDFVVGALDRTAADSLAANPRFSATVNAGGTSSAGLGFFDFSAVRGLIEDAVPEEDRPRYETEMRPFIEPFSHLTYMARTENDIIVSNVFLYVE
jgi:hypothetical protein